MQILNAKNFLILENRWQNLIVYLNTITDRTQSLIEIKFNLNCVVGRNSAIEAQGRANEEDWARWNPGWSDGGRVAGV